MAAATPLYLLRCLLFRTQAKNGLGGRFRACNVSGSIGGANSNLSQEYLVSIKKLLASEPPKNRVWVSVISPIISEASVNWCVAGLRGQGSIYGRPHRHHR